MNTPPSLLAYEDSADRVPVLWLHGFPLNNTMWDHQVSGLADIARLITPDLRGHGLTPPATSPVTMATMADDCIQLLDYLHCTEPVVVAGLSMGGYLAFEICRRHSHRVSGLILASTRAGADSDKVKATRKKAADTAIAQGTASIVEALLPKLLAPDRYEDDPDLVDFLRTMMLSTPPAGLAGAQGAMAGRPDSVPDLPELSVPTLVIHGTEDQLIPAAEAEAMAAALPKAEFLLIPGAGHMTNLEYPYEFNVAVREFLTQFYGQDNR